MDYVSNDGPTITKKGNFDLYHRIHCGINLPKKEIFDGLHKQVMRLLENKNWEAYVSRSCDLPKKEILMAYISDHWTHNY